MKRRIGLWIMLILLVVWVSTAAFAADEEVAINAANFPDANFRSYVSTQLDMDHNGVLSSAERDAVQHISVGKCSISSLKGLEHFPKLTTLNCVSNKLTSLDLSKNIWLDYLDCAGNQLTNLDLSTNTLLTELWCPGNKLTSLHLDKNTELKVLYCPYNQLSSLDVSKNTKLTRLDCTANQLTSMDIRQNSELVDFGCLHNQYTVTERQI